MSVITSSGLPAGFIMLYAGSGVLLPPRGWLWCDGMEYPESRYPALAAACNGMYGTASAGNFRVPNMRGRVAIASGWDETATRSPGQTLGAATHTLTAAEMPSHNHNVQENSGNGVLLGGHFTGAGQTSSYAGNVSSNAYPVQVTNTGGDGAHNNIQPSAVVGGYLIKT